MHVGYTCVQTSLPAASRRLLVAACLIVLPLSVQLERAASVSQFRDAKSNTIKSASPPRQVVVDPRATRLKRFFSKLHCPVVDMAEDFIRAADDNHLDWRLLPSISVIESSGGKAYVNNNIFGWGTGGPLPFPSIRAGLNEVAFKLGNSSLYRNRDVFGKLRLYNPDERYPYRVISVMNRISPVANLPGLMGNGRPSASDARAADPPKLSQLAF
jgi:hypothetical protein